MHKKTQSYFFILTPFPFLAFAALDGPDTMTAEQIADALFNAVDVDKSGAISLAEFEGRRGAKEEAKKTQQTRDKNRFFPTSGF